MMPGVSFQEIQEALVEAFTQPEFEMMLRLRMDERLDVLVGAGGFAHVVFQVISWSEREGRGTELIEAAFRHKPRNAKLQALYHKYGLAPGMHVQQRGVGTTGVSAATTDGGLQRIIRDGCGMIDFGVWVEKAARVVDQVCRVEVDGLALGTGFLVGPDAVLTNFHVLENVIDFPEKAAKVALRFDFKVLADGSVQTGREVSLAGDWLIDYSRYTQEEKLKRPDQRMPTLDELDHALVRTSERAGAEPVDVHASPGAPVRGWVRIPESSSELRPGQPLLIAQHPQRRPIKLALDTQSVLSVNPNGSRVRYATNTENGSSGSPVFDCGWELVALHHYGDPAYDHPAYNQGIPITAIRQRLVARGLAPALEAS